MGTLSYGHISSLLYDSLCLLHCKFVIPIYITHCSHISYYQHMGILRIIYCKSVDTWFKQRHRFETCELPWIHTNRLESRENLLQCPDVARQCAGFGLIMFQVAKQRTCIHRHGPLDGAEQEQFSPCFLQ